MSLRTRVLLVFAPSVALFIAAMYAALSYQIMTGYLSYETQYVEEHVLRLRDTIEQRVQEICQSDWGAWDDTYQFIDDLNDGYIQENINAPSFAAISIDTLIFVDQNGAVRFAKSFDLNTGKEESVAPALLAEVKPGSPLLSHKNERDIKSGILSTASGVMVVGSQPIVKSNFQGPIRGTLIVAKHFDQALSDAIGNQLHVDIHIHPITALNQQEEGIRGELASLEQRTAKVVARGEDLISGYMLYPDLYGTHALLLEVVRPRQIYTQALSIRRTVLYIVTAIGLISGLGLMLSVEMLIVSRLRRFSRQVTAIRTEGNPAARISVSGSDELSSLAREMNSLMGALDSAARRDSEREARYRLLTQSAPVGIFEAQPDGECIFVNPRWCELTGLSTEQARGTGWLAAVVDEDRERVMEVWNHTVQTGTPMEVECRFSRPDEILTWVLMTSIPVRDEYGVSIGHIGCVMDITARKRADQELRESEARYRAIIDTQVELVCRYRPDTALVYVNDAYCVYFGREREEMLGRSFLDFAPDSRFRSREEAILALHDLKGSVTSRRKIVAANGEVRWQEWEDTPVRNARGEVLEYQAIGRDITERKIAEDALRESEAKLRSITASVAEAIIMMNSEGNVTFWNEAAERIFGYKRRDILGLALHDHIVPERYRAAFHAGHGPFLQTGQGPIIGQSHEMQGLRKDGTEFPLELYVASVKFGGEWHAIGTGRDITERKRTEEQLAANAREMETANVQLEEAIAQANQLALEAQVASVAKSDFVANMSHEIRTPLNGVIGMTTLLLDTNLSREQREFAEMVRTSGEALLSVVNDILDFSKIEAGKMELESIPFDLRSAVEQIGDILAPRAQEKGLEFTILIHHDVPEYVQGDPGRLRQVLLNLSGNALKFTERGEIVVTVQLKARAGNLTTVLFEVMDSGIGIAENRMQALFQPFTQADSSTTRKYGGTGLGLTISKRLCEAMGGEIGVRSKIGGGSTFYFTAVLDALPAPEQPAAPNLEILAGMRLLVIDSSATGRKVYRELLRNHGVSVEDAADAQTGYEMMRAAATHAAPFSVVLVDHYQPKLDARGFAEAVKSDPVVHAARLLLITSWPKRGDAGEMAQFGYEAYLTKPVKRAHLLDAIAAVASRSTGAKDAGSKIVTQHSLNEFARKRNRILLVEDNVINQKVAIRLLERLGFRCDLANNGREALEAATHNQYDLILMDCQMPEMDGYESTRAIRQYEGSSRYTPILALTASTLRADHEQCVDAGMDAVLTKPIRTEALEDSLNAFLSDNPPIRGKRKGEGHVVEPPTEKPVDLQRLNEISMGDTELESELIVTFLADTAERLTDLAKTIAAGDLSQLGRTAHALKGSAGNMGASTLQNLARDLEELGKSGALDVAGSAYDKLREEADRVRAYLSEYMHA